MLKDTFQLDPWDPLDESHQPVSKAVPLPPKVRNPWWKRTFICFLCLATVAIVFAVHQLTPLAMDVWQAMEDTEHSEPFFVEVEGRRHSLAGFIDNEPCAAVEISPKPIILRNNWLRLQTLNLFKDDDLDGDYDLICKDIKEYAVLQGGSYRVESQPYDTTKSQAQSCLIRLDRTMPDSVNYADSSAN